MGPPEEESILQAEAGSLKKQAINETAVVLEVVSGAQGIVQVTHAWREGFVGQGVDHVWGDAIYIVQVIPGGEVLASVTLVKVVQEIHQSLITVQLRQCSGGDLREQMSCELLSVLCYVAVLYFFSL